MASILTIGRLEPSKEGVGGIKAVMFLNYDTAILAKLTVVDEQITAVSGLIPAFRYELKGANTFDETNENSRDNGTSVWSGAGTFIFKRQSLASQKEMRILSYGRPHIILEMYDGSYRLAGRQNGSEVTVNTASGADMADFTGYNASATTKEAGMALFIEASLIGHATAGFSITNGV